MNVDKLISELVRNKEIDLPIDVCIKQLGQEPKVIENVIVEEVLGRKVVVLQ